MIHFVLRNFMAESPCQPSFFCFVAACRLFCLPHFVKLVAFSALLNQIESPWDYRTLLLLAGNYPSFLSFSENDNCKRGEFSFCVGANTVQKRIFLYLPLIMTIYFNGSRHARIDYSVNRNSEPRELIFWLGVQNSKQNLECYTGCPNKVLGYFVLVLECEKLHYWT